MLEDRVRGEQAARAGAPCALPCGARSSDLQLRRERENVRNGANLRFDALPWDAACVHLPKWRSQRACGWQSFRIRGKERSVATGTQPLWSRAFQFAHAPRPGRHAQSLPCGCGTAQKASNWLCHVRVSASTRASAREPPCPPAQKGICPSQTWTSINTTQPAQQPTCGTRVHVKLALKSYAKLAGTSRRTAVSIHTTLALGQKCAQRESAQWTASKAVGGRGKKSACAVIFSTSESLRTAHGGPAGVGGRSLSSTDDSSACKDRKSPRRCTAF
eukprot:1467665-Pleurochrysis_carterae.AAC.3